MKSYVYKPLLADEIRVLELEPCELFEDSLNCKIHQARFDDSLAYTALSYTWGDPSVTSHLAVDGHDLQITKNLDSALRHLRQNKRYWLLWVDAVCVNQMDLKERSSQVQLMKTIYEKAHSVVAWLGSEADNSNMALDKMMEITRWLDDRKAALGSLSSVLSYISEEDVFGPPDKPNNFQEWTVALKRLFNRDWWFRMWVIQEATANSNTTLVSGSRAIPFDTVGATALYLGHLFMRPGLEGLHAIGHGGGSRIFQFKALRHLPGRDFSLLSLLAVTRKSEATDSRDKVFAMLPFATDVQPGMLKPDYTMQVSEVYTNVAIWSVYTHQNLDFLGHCSHTNENPNPQHPSWLPDWTDRSERSPFVKRLGQGNGTFIKAYNASGSSLPYDPRDSRMLLPVANGRTIVRGFCLDTIRTCLEASTDAVNTEVERSWAPDNGSETYRPTGETMDEAYRRTIVADVFGLNGTAGHRGYSMLWPTTGGFEQREEHMNHTNLMAALKEATVYRRFIITSGAFVGLAPHDAQEGDGIFIFLGGQVPYVVREKGGAKYQFIGECYIHGVMDGEAMKTFDGNKEILEDANTRIEPIVLE